MQKQHIDEGQKTLETKGNNRSIFLKIIAENGLKISDYSVEELWEILQMKPIQINLTKEAFITAFNMEDLKTFVQNENLVDLPQKFIEKLEHIKATFYADKKTSQTIHEKAIEILAYFILEPGQQKFHKKCRQLQVELFYAVSSGVDCVDNTGRQFKFTQEQKKYLLASNNNPVFLAKILEKYNISLTLYNAADLTKVLECNGLQIDEDSKKQIADERCKRLTKIFQKIQEKGIANLLDADIQEASRYFDITGTSENSYHLSSVESTIKSISPQEHIHKMIKQFITEYPHIKIELQNITEQQKPSIFVLAVQKATIRDVEWHDCVRCRTTHIFFQK
jgi:hypothetical protein